MIEFRWYKETQYADKKLQYKLLFAPHLIASGDIVLYQLEKPVWVTIETVIGKKV